MNPKIASLLRSRRFWVTVVGVAGVVSSEFFGIELDLDQLVTIGLMVSGWVIGDTIRETK